MFDTKSIKAKYNKQWLLLKLCIDKAAILVKFNKEILVYKGQGDGDTK